jgi:hypothetical protein
MNIAYQRASHRGGTSDLKRSGTALASQTMETTS